MPNISSSSGWVGQVTVAPPTPAPRSGDISPVASTSIEPTPPAAAVEVQAPSRAPTMGELKELVSAMESKVNATSPELRFAIDQSSGKTVIKVSDQTTKEVIWQFPSESALRISQEMEKYVKGLVVNRKV